MGEGLHGGWSDSRIYEQVKDAHETLLSWRRAACFFRPSSSSSTRLGNRIFRVARLEKPPSYLQDPCGAGGPRCYSTGGYNWRILPRKAHKWNTTLISLSWSVACADDAATEGIRREGDSSHRRALPIAIRVHRVGGETSGWRQEWGKATMSVLDANVYELSSRRAALPIGISPNCNCIVCGSS